MMNDIPIVSNNIFYLLIIYMKHLIIIIIIVCAFYILYKYIYTKEHYINFGKYGKYIPPTWSNYGYYTPWYKQAWTFDYSPNECYPKKYYRYYRQRKYPCQYYYHHFNMN